MYDEDCAVARLMAEAYRRVLPGAMALRFHGEAAEKIKAEIKSLAPGDFVILVQSGSFRLDAFRIRVHLFEQGLKVIEHPHLDRVKEEEVTTYIDSLAYDKN